MRLQLFLDKAYRKVKPKSENLFLHILYASLVKIAPSCQVYVDLMYRDVTIANDA